MMNKVFHLGFGGNFSVLPSQENTHSILRATSLTQTTCLLREIQEKFRQFMIIGEH